MRKIVITGGNGFLGSHLIRELNKLGHRIVLLKRKTSNLTRIQTCLDRMKAYNIEEVDLATLFQEEGQIDAVIHTATCYGRRNEDITTIFEANTQFPLRLLEMAIKFKVKTFMNTDTILYKDINSYSLSKKQFLDWGILLSNRGEISFINLKLENMYGPGENDTSFISYIIRNLMENIPELPLTGGEQRRDFIYIGDVVSAIILVLEKSEASGRKYLEFEVGSGKGIAIREVVEYLHQVTHSKTILKFGALPYRANEVMHSEANIAALSALGWRCRTDLYKGISEIIEEEGTVSR